MGTAQTGRTHDLHPTASRKPKRSLDLWAPSTHDLKPSQGLDHPPNYLLFYWVQGYVSGANFLLLNEYNNYVDMNGVEPGKILKLVFDFCKANPNDKPISAIDKFIRDAKKVEVSEKDAFNPWEQ
jgi:hypothetical protein